MKPITVHPMSVLAGLALAGVLTVLAGAAQTSTRVQPIPKETVRLVGEIPASWWTYVVLTDPAQPFIVPTDRYFAVTYVYGNAAVAMNGAYGPELWPLRVTSSGVEDRNGTRVVYPPGAAISPVPGTGTVQLWGYLEPVP